MPLLIVKASKIGLYHLKLTFLNLVHFLSLLVESLHQYL